MNVPLHYHLCLGAALFAIGTVGFLTRRNLITIFLSVELMLQGVMLNLVAFASHHGQMTGQAFAMMVVTVAACEAGVALAMILTLYKSRKSLDVSVWQDLRESSVDATSDPFPIPAMREEPPLPKLPEAGRLPARRREDSYV
jgi:NADH-quinone oxidoreductase subunit K